MDSGTWGLVIHKTHEVDDDQLFCAASESERQQRLSIVVIKLKQ